MAENEDANIISKIEKKKADSKKENLDMVIASSKYAVGGESTEVPASADLDDTYLTRSKNKMDQNKNCEKCGKKLDRTKEIPLCNDCERIHD